MSKRRRVRLERVVMEDRAAEVAAVLQYYAKHPERYRGLMVIAETAEGGYEAKYTGAASAAERIGQLELLKDQMLDDAAGD